MDEDSGKVLSYHGPPPVGPPYVEDEKTRRWRYRRVPYYALWMIWLLFVGCYIGPHVFLFHKFTRLTPSDFVPIVQSGAMSTVLAIKQYQSDNGVLPADLDALAPRYMAARPVGAKQMDNGKFLEWDGQYGNHQIEYNFQPGAEGWSVSGSFANGPIPLPPVTLGPSTKP